MSEGKPEDATEGRIEVEVESEAASSEASGTASAAAEAESIESLREALAQATADVDAIRDQALRAQAEAENVRRRAERDVANAHKFALERFTSDLLPVIDSFEKAVETARSHAEADAAAVVAIAEGVELSLKLLFDVLDRVGVKAIDPTGEPFDPQYHEAMSLVESPDAEPNSVLHVVQKGYTLNDRLVRAAMVMVAKAASAAPDGGAGSEGR